jgi:hypothetical protein
MHILTQNIVIINHTTINSTDRDEHTRLRVIWPMGAMFAVWHTHMYCSQTTSMCKLLQEAATPQPKEG